MRPLLRLALPLTLLCTPLVAHSQPADDPSLSEPQTPPSPSVTRPPTQPMPLRVQETLTGSAADAPSPEGRVAHETVTETVTWQRGSSRPPEEDLYEATPAPSVDGPIGLFHVLTGENGRQNTFRVGLDLQLFKGDDFLIAGNASTRGDQDTRLKGNLSISYTPWKYFELYLALYNSSNQNVRVDAMRSDPEVILSLGDVGTGLKARLPVTPWFDVGLNLGLRFFNSVSKESPLGAATNFAPDLIASFDLRHAEATRKVPLRFHINFGYLVDNSIKLLSDNPCASTTNDACIRSRVVETFAYGIGPSRFRLAGAVDAPLTLGHTYKVGLEFFAEYHVEIAVGDGDQTMVRALANDANISASRLTGNSLQYMTFGARVRPVAGLILDAGVDVGLSSPGFQYGSPVPAWNLVLGAAYAYDPVGARGHTKIVTRTVTREAAPEPEGKLRGVVRDAVTKKPLGGVTIRYTSRRATSQLTADDGSFVSYGFAPGPINLEAARDDYEPAKVQPIVSDGRETPVEILLMAKPPSNGLLHGRVNDADGNPVTGATVHLMSPQTGAILQADPDGPAGFQSRLPPGEYQLEVSADGYLSKQRTITIDAGQPNNVEVVLRKQPKQAHVSVGKGELVIKGVIHFGTNNAEIRPDGAELLDEVADVLVKHPELRKLRVEGHTDNRGNAEKNLELSKARAAAVVAYLVKEGIDPARLESEGFGSSQPLVPNITPAQRAKNRRVAFKILETAPGVAP